MKAYTK